ncbi:CheR family methyltransferase [Azospirillum agricola]|uniref:CheR family methyltransferase n=1 Tax=Azospirillum agricola TaxID=1720247 RepID=UPI000A0F3595|nr:CheR family methyltransferase [Azospirillum agricola]SMH28948.1 MCP methyltransferase, CheR-type [Azospirillum lipoferum]
MMSEVEAPRFIGEPAPPSSRDGLSPRDFGRLAVIIESHTGIRMPPTKRTMVEGRLRRRLRTLGLPDMNAYCRHVLDGGGLDGELVSLIDAVTTNKTDFFREIDHFRYLMGTAIPALSRLPHHPGRDRPLKIWSAACSTGAEPYTVAMLLLEQARAGMPIRHEIVATDICTEALDTARMGIYPADMARMVPEPFASRYLMRSRDPEDATVRLVPPVRQSVRFGRLNMMDPAYPVSTDMDVIFFRNILIYFDKATQKKVLEKLCGHLRPGGCLFIGHSETITNMDLPLKQAGSAIFIRS